MALSNGPNLGLLVNGLAGEVHYTELMKQWRGLDALLQGKVIDQDLTAPPGSPLDGDCYIIAAAATGVWTGKSEFIARYSSLLLDWEYYTPKAGWTVFVVDEGEFYFYTGTEWELMEPLRGPASSTADAIALFDGTGGSLIKVGPTISSDEALGTSDVILSTQRATKVYIDAAVNTRLAGSAIGTLVQGYSAELQDFVDLAPTNLNILQYRTTDGWIDRTPTQITTDLQGDGLTVSSAGFRGIPINSKSTAYTLVADDMGKCIYHPSADTTARVWTIPANATVAFPIGAVVTFDNDYGAGAITISIAGADVLSLAGVSGLTGSRTLASGGQATAIKVTATRWRISGTGLS